LRFKAFSIEHKKTKTFHNFVTFAATSRNTKWKCREKILPNRSIY